MGVYRMGRLSVWNVDTEVLKAFKNFVISKHGKLHSALSEEVTNALREYLKTRAHTHSEKGSRIVRDAKILKREILKIAEPGGTLHKNQITQLAVRNLGIGDWRSIKIRVNYLVATDFLSTGMYRGTYIVKGGLHNETSNP